MPITFRSCDWIRSSTIGFTLIELLVVTAILGLLAGLILPTLARARARGGQVTCLSNLRQWGMATQLFVLENADLLPKDGAPNGTSTEAGWYIDLPKALGLPRYHEQPWRTNAAAAVPRSVWICPSNRRRSNGNNLFHYSLNSHVNAAGTGNQVAWSSIREPAQVVWLFDNGRLAAVSQQNNVHTNAHSQGAQFLFLDGHARWFSVTEFWDTVTGRGRTNHAGLKWVPRS